jgi:hypothetical protein
MDVIAFHRDTERTRVVGTEVKTWQRNRSKTRKVARSGNHQSRSRYPSIKRCAACSASLPKTRRPSGKPLTRRKSEPDCRSGLSLPDRRLGLSSISLRFATAEPSCGQPPLAVGFLGVPVVYLNRVVVGLVADQRADHHGLVHESGEPGRASQICTPVTSVAVGFPRAGELP